MNCDEAFDFLTTPNNRPNKQFEGHLAMCPRCRQMKETLEPALAMFNTNAAAEGHAQIDFLLNEELPQHETFRQDTVSAETVQLAESTAAEFSAQVPPGWPRLRKAAALVGSQVALIFLGAVIAFGLFHIPEDLQTSSMAVASETCLWQNSNRTDQLPNGDPHTVASTCLRCHWKEASASKPVTIHRAATVSSTDCLWVSRPGPSPEFEITARSMILSCMGCHL